MVSFVSFFSGMALALALVSLLAWVLLRPQASDWFVTFTGRRVHPTDLAPSDIAIEDIAHALAYQCRCAGHVRAYYSVAQHSVLVSQHLPPSLALAGLLHDAAEAYCQDLIRPLKYLPALFGYRRLEKRIERAVAARFGLSYPWPPAIKEADNRLLQTERRDLIAPHAWPWFSHRVAPYPDPISPLGPEAAEALFLARYRELTETKAEGGAA